ncbi:hypothetical protein [Nostoc sp. UIC 10630]|uniref:hypothetical protein n=1 Tax=Nostoc sp. UIC 10630 TaxID=2100146 RepID=UPI0013D26F0E|nr:hypothetical protein [Nostoc sp. UIC 10630]NEU81246.1 hypothetical protein [Nostoc sp. UIC 10630]
MDTIGEAQVTQFFSNALQDEIQKKWGHNAIFLFGNFAGKQDKKFADFFAGTRSKNILIEFKESKRNLKDELRKPLRESLCFTLNDEIATLSRKCHFAAWREKNVKGDVNISINIIPYIDEVCKQFGDLPGLVKNLLMKDYPTFHEKFIEKFLLDEVGVSYTEFKDYINHLSEIANFKDRDNFKAVLYSRDNNTQKLRGTQFSNLNQALELINLNPPI